MHCHIESTQRYYVESLYESVGEDAILSSNRINKLNDSTLSFVLDARRRIEVQAAYTERSQSHWHNLSK